MDTHDVLHLKYRPDDFDLMLGQNAVVQSLQHFEQSGTWPHTFLFTGPSGCGKTTLARIIARKVGCQRQNLLEVDAATHTGIDAMRELADQLQYRGIGGDVKVAIIDECHALSKQSWQSLLKIVEEPPNHVYFVFCTTETGKVPNTISTRAASYTLGPLAQDVIVQFVEDIATLEEITLPQHGALVIAEACKGSPRQALVHLAQASGGVSLDVLRQIVEVSETQAAVIDLCRLLIQPRVMWKDVRKCLNAIEAVPPETIRISVSRYLTSVILNTEKPDRAGILIERLDAFHEPYNLSDGLGPLICSCAAAVAWK